MRPAQSGTNGNRGQILRDCRVVRTLHGERTAETLVSLGNARVENDGLAISRLRLLWPPVLQCDVAEPEVCFSDLGVNAQCSAEVCRGSFELTARCECIAEIVVRLGKARIFVDGLKEALLRAFRIAPSYEQ